VGRRACSQQRNSKDVLNDLGEVGEFEKLFSEMEAEIGLDKV
jgi:hypothetical protein